MAIQRKKKITMSILLPFVVFALFFSIMIFQKYRASHDLPTVPSPQNSEGRQPVTLFFAKDGIVLVREAREIEPCADDVACLKGVMEELLHGPVGELDETVPEGVIVESVSLAGSQAIIGLSRIFSEGLLSGSSAEIMAVYSVVNTVAVNFPHIQTVKIDVDGNKNTILPHLDLSDPLAPDYTLEQLSPHGVSEGTTQHPQNSGIGAKR